MAAEKQTVIGSETRVTGEISGDEPLLVKGRVDGRIRLGETLTIDKGGIVQADVEVRALVVSGVLVGSITASESVRLVSKARVVGNITAPRVAIEPGAAYRGRVEMGEVELASARATTSASRVAPAKAPPRLATPARAASSAATTAAAKPVAPPRAVSVPPRPTAAVAKGPAPAWARKKARRR